MRIAVPPTALALLFLLAITPPVRAQERLTSLDTLDVADLAARVTQGETLRIDSLTLGTDRVEALELERFEMFAPDAQIVVHRSTTETTSMPTPRNLYFRGRIVGEPDSTVTLTALQRGGVRGLLTSGGESWIVATPRDRVAGEVGPVQTRRIDDVVARSGDGRSFSCDTDSLQTSDELLPAFLSNSDSVRDAARAAAEARSSQRGSVPSYTARVAIETDYEFFQLFGSTEAAVDYIGDLFAYASGIYSTEVDTSLLLSSIDLWSTAADPWDQSGSSCALFQFGKYWNDNHGDNTRTIAHFLSGKNSNSGIAWVGVLCGGGFNTSHGGGCPGIGPDVSNYGGGYGFTGGIDGNFDINNPAIVWDIEAVAHEIGHNFNSPHSHCYAGLGGNAAPVDECYAGQCGANGCYCGGATLPCSETGAGCGTIMSYCHLLSGGLSNISLTFGSGHPYGTAPGRVPSRMNDHVVLRAAGSPGCLDFAAPSDVFSDGFESGDPSRWSSITSR